LLPDFKQDINTGLSMKATYNKNAKTKFTTFHRKENKCYFDSYTALAACTNYEGKPDLKPVVELRLYGTGNSNTAAIWVHESRFMPGDGTIIELHTSGTGAAGGYGYHRPSAAAAEAIRNAGFELSEDISGRGDSSIELAVKAIAEALGYPNCPVFHAHQ
jgi:hypothetical protein